MWTGMIALTCWAGAALPGPGDAPEGPPWRLPDEALGARMAPILLLSRPDVQHELQMGDEQVASGRGAIVELFARAASLRGRSGADAVASRREVDDSARRWLGENLTAEQLGRLGQIELQWEGAAALLSRPTIAASLGLTDEQRSRLSESLSRPPAPGEGPVDAHRRRHRDAASILTEDQRLRWLAMLGPPFEPGAARAAEAVASGG
ncbi:hypothetical protein [Tautonia plasticadhaerens]|uniref:LTXXQ motif protein n=1 Tax=Tautonia plasticadhaerens TaxID=2527974 RepID=A0A518H564_9BACT|nr:hypothetical protein [Tautonia plasticadhaerens]QDV35985.1 hypothetical protein ElP_38950 [Tautonia plasticadhaerens]